VLHAQAGACVMHKRHDNRVTESCQCIYDGYEIDDRILALRR